MKRFLKGFGIVLALAAVGVISAFAVVALLLRQEEVRAPDLTGQDIVTAIETVSQQGLQLKVERREPHPTLPRDTVISQTPAPGNGIKKGRPVRIIVSQGTNETQTPNLVGEHMRKAEMTVRQAGFFPGAMSRAWSEVVQRDVVIAQDPAAGNPLARGGKISLLVSSGKKTTVLVMPKLIGKKAEEAVRTIERTGLQHRVVYKPSGSATAGVERVVIGQKPGPGYPVSADATVEIVVSK
jgi:eukaryotic-like serine/threonine-protein kinase